MGDNIEYPKLRKINGTDLAYILAPCGVYEKNGFDKYLDYLASKTEDLVVNNKKNTRTLRDYCYKIYKIEGRSREELEKAIKNNSAKLVGDMLFSAVNQNLQVDDNGNLVLRSYGSDLDDIMIAGGDVLISKDGEVLRNTRGQMFIHSCDPFGNYPVDVFVSGRISLTDSVEITRIDYNFLNESGKMLCKQNFQRMDTPAIIEVKRVYTDNSEDKMFMNKSVYPTAYVYNWGRNGERPTLFPSATALLIENRVRKLEMPESEPYVGDETPYIIAHYKRLSEIPSVIKKLTEKYKKDEISMAKYRRAMEALKSEQDLIRLFSNEFETPHDLYIAEESPTM